MRPTTSQCLLLATLLSRPTTCGRNEKICSESPTVRDRRGADLLERAERGRTGDVTHAVWGTLASAFNAAGDGVS